MELKVALAMSFLAMNWAAPALNTRSSRLMGEPVGATLPTQLAGVLQFWLAPSPLHVNVAGASRFSSCSNRSWVRRVRMGLTCGRSNDRNQPDQEKKDMGTT